MSTNQIQSADVVKDATGRQYHINLAPGELAPYIILVGDRKRAIYASQFLENIRVERENREYHTFTGEYKGTPLSIMSTGMGPGCTEIGLIEIFQTIKNPTFIRVGTSGGLQEFMNLGDFVISSGGVRLEDTSTYFVQEGYAAVANHEVILALVAAAQQQEVPFHVGLTATGSGFYGAQGRKVPGIHVRNPNITEELAATNVYNLEMEASTLFTLANMVGARSSAICQVLAHRTKGAFLSPEIKKDREKRSLMTALEAMRILERMDKQKAAKNQNYWSCEKLTEGL